MRSTISAGLLGILVATGGARAASAPTFETMIGSSVDEGADLSLQLAMPVWWDVTGDGVADLISMSAFGVERVRLDADGALAMTPITLPDEAQRRNQVLRPLVALAPVDVDGDGVDELLGIGQEATLMRMVGVDQIGIAPVHLPAFRARGTNDVAVGDLNRDGLPDLYLAIGIGYVERANLQGRSDIILMNRGEGRFEVIDATPTRRGVTNSVTLVDIDGDGWLDVVESVDTSWITGSSRLLFNRTQPGDTHPTFVPSEETWDSGTDGMGAAVADVDGDGYLDIYNTSLGHDLLVMGGSDGRFVDATYDKGLLHRWSTLGMRSQWAPTFVDLDLDGRLDLLVRHGQLKGTSSGVLPTSWAEDLVYTQGDDGGFSRQSVPVQSGIGGGMRFAVGDLDGDGRPDAGRDGLANEVLVWRNTTPVDADTRLLTLRFAPTVSGSPPTGTIVDGTCGDVTHTRHITSGGKMGTTGAYEASMAWPGCGGETVDLEVRWPSGAVTTDTVPAEETAWRTEEPRWLQEGTGNGLILDPTGVGAEEVCLALADGTWSCCSTRCELERPTTGPAVVRLDDRAPMSLPAREASWLLVTTPHLPRPGFHATLHVLHVGSPDTFPGDDAVLHLDGVEVPWETVDEATRTLSAKVKLDWEAVVLPLTLTVNGEEVGAWSPSAGVVFDSARVWSDVYPVRPIGASVQDGNWKVNIHPAPGVSHSGLLAMLSATTADGDSVPIASAYAGTARLGWATMEISWPDLAGIDTLFIRDRSAGIPLTLPVVQPPDTATLLELVDSAQCGLHGTRLWPTRGRVQGAVTLMDSSGCPVVVPAGLVELESQGGTIINSLTYPSGFMDGFFGLKAGDTLGPGQIVVRGIDGVERGRCAFTVTQWPTRPVDLAASWATLSRTEITRGSGEIARLRVGLANDFGELVGAATKPDVLISPGGTWVSPLALTDGGSMSGDIGVTGDADTVTITVTLNDELIETFSLTVTEEPVTEEPVAEEPPDSAPDAPRPSSGCGGGDTPRTPALFGLLLLVLALRQRFTHTVVSSRRPTE